ncbi:hypothetical protein [Pseudemcibacter aquimaris]|uniref:hypothetical protein n=1 Tax=Pseudemcibacter aquimaris TaxID=2857064 RepID=UPI0020125A50|nr:hypothetical protein [Pseudemcibacter aquimaris]MCC3860838.1 hypothetical protein [Pseudemcibacter aquimaris]WDU59657.1 hypothetical protein KW060_05210 [Pseudemcibacter aquimaris]
MNGLDLHMDMVDDHNVDYETLLPLYYQFNYHGINFDCEVINSENYGSYDINLTAQIGYLPYSSENKSRREKILKNFSHLMAHNLITLDHHCNLTFPVSTTINGEINAKKVMETILYTLLDVKEVLEIIADTMNVLSIEDGTNQKA